MNLDQGLEVFVEHVPAMVEQTAHHQFRAVSCMILFANWPDGG